MKIPKPKVCEECQEEDEVIWDKKREQWLCSLCIDSLNAQDDFHHYEQDEALRSMMDGEE